MNTLSNISGYRISAGKMVAMNIFRILGDVSHTVSKCILIWAIHSNRSAEGKPLPLDLSLWSPLTGLSDRCLFNHTNFVRRSILYPIPRSFLPVHAGG